MNIAMRLVAVLFAVTIVSAALDMSAAADDIPKARVPPPDSGQFKANPQPKGATAPAAPSPAPPAAAPSYVAPPPHPSGRFAHIAPGQWFEVPNSHLRSAAPKAGPVPAQLATEDYQTRLGWVIGGYNGGGYDTKRDCLIVWGGGHDGYTGNEVYRFCLATLKWERMTEPSSFNAMGNAPAWKDGDVAMPDGTPVNAHSYDGIEYIPDIDKFLVFGAYTFKTGKAAAAWLLDPETKKWTMLEPKDDNIVVVYDPVTHHAFAQNNFRLLEFDPAAGTWKRLMGGSYSWPAELTAAIDPEQHLLVGVGTGQVRMYNLNSKAGFDAAQGVVTSGDTDIVSAIGPGFVWDPQIHKFVAWKGGTDVYTLDPKTWVWTKIAAAPGNAANPGNAAGTGTYGRFRYIPSEDLFLVVNSTDSNVFLYRIDDKRAAPPTVMPPPTIQFYAQDATLESGRGTTLVWNSANATECSGSGDWSGAKPISGRLDTLPFKDSKAFTLSCKGPAGTSTKTVKVKVLTTAEMNDGIVHVCPQDAVTDACEFTNLAAAARSAKSGDTILLAPGVYKQCAVIRAPNITLKGKGAHLKDAVCEDKGALDWKGDNGTVEDIECSGISVSDGNGACLRIEDGAKTMTVRGVNFHDNDEGILGGVSGGEILVENSRIERNGRGGRAHGLYIAQVDSFTIRNSQILSSQDEGHEIKSRAAKTLIENNVIASLDGNDSRCIDVPNGGETVIRGNVIEKGPKSANTDMIGIAREFEKGLHPKNSTLVENNVIIFDDHPGDVLSSNSPAEIVFRNNKVVGARSIGVKTTGGDNKTFANRAEAGLKPFPALPPLP